MKLGLVFLLFLVYYLLPAECSIGETDVVRVFDPSVRMPRERLRALLRKADLISAGFTKTVETQVVTDEDGKKVTKEVTYYSVKDSCSNVSYWEGIIRERLPTFSEALTRKVIREVDQRTDGRATEYCRFGLEIHFKLCGHVEKPRKREKRFLWGRRRRRSPPPPPRPSLTCVGTCVCCNVCGRVDIGYRRYVTG